ncbi:myosin-1 protein [Spatholobus suberectus]|nr:myosin-1 protein [Spatholobus suberectus]
MNVPDPDFHDFDGDRIENAFGENQVWAVYDNDDGMPRYYCLIHEVISKNPFHMRISWLNAKGNDELAPIKWVGCGFLKTSGDFRIGKRLSYSTLNSFSHRVKWTKGSRGVVHIYPKKGDIWALYRNWSLDWNEFTDDEIIQKYDMVEVLEEYSEEQGVNVAPLVKVAGFKTVFRQNVNPRKVRNIPKAEMFRFSHQVPSYLLTGEEGHNAAPKGCLELDPAATPMELLQVVAEDLEQELVMTTEKSVEDELRQKENSREEDGLVERCQTTKEEGSDEGLGEKKSKPEILFVYKRRRIGEKRELRSGK